MPPGPVQRERSYEDSPWSWATLSSVRVKNPVVMPNDNVPLVLMPLPTYSEGINRNSF